MTAEPQVGRPAPVITDDNAAFWAAAREQRLITQRCDACGRLRHPPRPMCPACHSLEWEMTDLVGTGTVYSYAVLHHPQHPAFTYPVIAVLVDLDEGVRLLSNLVGVDASRARIGMRVQVAFEPAVDDTAVPVFHPLGAEQ